jgi:glycosyltransferase involved in cell wall biosynthesis
MPDSFATPIRMVSVVMRSMDRASLQRAMGSVVEQSHRPIELVLVNALGSAHSPLPAAMEDIEVRIVADAAGRPYRRASAAQAGLQAATGEWVLYLDDDDLLLPDHLSRLMCAGQASVEAPAVYADVEMGSEVAGEWQVQHLFAADFDPVRLLFENYLPIHAVLFRREVALRHASFDTDFDLFEDWDFWLQLAQVADFVRVPGVSARYVAPQVAGRSEVFEDTPAARTARERLFEKWRQRLSPGLYARALHRLQSLHRQAGHQQAQLIDLQRGHAEQGAVLQAREAELADYAPRLAAREAELASSSSRSSRATTCTLRST